LAGLVQNERAMEAQRTERVMRARLFAMITLLAVVAIGTSGCFTTRMVRSDTVTSYDLVRAERSTPPVVPEGTVVAAVVPPAPSGTLVVEALSTPPPAAHPVRLPDSVAGASVAHVTVTAQAPAWSPLPSYVGQFSGPGWEHRSIFAGSTGGMPSQHWGRGGWATTPGTTTSTGSYGSASPHFSSSPSYSGSASSHFAGGAHFSGY
jgi:hypothetical protein